jgi:hypothetical protein
MKMSVQLHASAVLLPGKEVQVPLDRRRLLTPFSQGSSPQRGLQSKKLVKTCHLGHISGSRPSEGYWLLKFANFYTNKKTGISHNMPVAIY